MPTFPSLPAFAAAKGFALIADRGWQLGAAFRIEAVTGTFMRPVWNFEIRMTLPEHSSLMAEE